MEKLRLSSYNIHRKTVFKLLVLAKLKGREKPHLLFYGPPGTGKTTVARLYVQHHGLPASNVLRLNASNTRGIDTIRGTVLEFVRYKPLVGFAKFLILDEADYLTNDAQAALREIMEQYRAYSHFILVCNNPSKLSAAIRSRCASMAFPALNAIQSKAVCNNLQEETGMRLKPAEVEELIKLAAGDIRKIRNYLLVPGEQNVDFSRFWEKPDTQLLAISRQEGAARKCLETALCELIEAGGYKVADAICTLADCDIAIAQGATESIQLIATATKIRRLLS